MGCFVLAKGMNGGTSKYRLEIEYGTPLTRAKPHNQAHSPTVICFREQRYPSVFSFSLVSHFNSRDSRLFSAFAEDLRNGKIISVEDAQGPSVGRLIQIVLTAGLKRSITSILV
jgi:hypothetical protein